MKCDGRENVATGEWNDAMDKILLAEDDNDMRRFLARALANAGYEVISLQLPLCGLKRNVFSDGS